MHVHGWETYRVTCCKISCDHKMHFPARNCLTNIVKLSTVLCHRPIHFNSFVCIQYTFHCVWINLPVSLSAILLQPFTLYSLGLFPWSFILYLFPLDDAVRMTAIREKDVNEMLPYELCMLNFSPFSSLNSYYILCICLLMTKLSWEQWLGAVMAVQCSMSMTRGFIKVSWLGQDSQ